MTAGSHPGRQSTLTNSCWSQHSWKSQGTLYKWAYLALMNLGVPQYHKAPVHAADHCTLLPHRDVPDPWSPCLSLLPLLLSPCLPLLPVHLSPCLSLLPFHFTGPPASLCSLLPLSCCPGGYDHIVKLWDVRAGPQATMSVDHGAPVEDVAFFPSGGLMVSAGGTSICVWDLLRYALRALVCVCFFWGGGEC